MSFHSGKGGLESRDSRGQVKLGRGNQLQRGGFDLPDLDMPWPRTMELGAVIPQRQSSPHVTDNGQRVTKNIRKTNGSDPSKPRAALGTEPSKPSSTPARGGLGSVFLVDDSQNLGDFITRDKTGHDKNTAKNKEPAS